MYGQRLATNLLTQRPPRIEQRYDGQEYDWHGITRGSATSKGATTIGGLPEGISSVNAMTK